MDSKTCPDCGYIAYYDSYFKAIVCHQCGYHHIVDPLEDYRKLSSIEQLNFYRNLHYKDGENTESKIIAEALNEILPIAETIMSVYGTEDGEEENSNEQIYEQSKINRRR